MENYGISVSSAGQDALLQRQRDRSYDSKFSTLKIYIRKYISITTNGSGAGSGGIVHNLGYCPTFYVWRKATASFSFLDASSYTNAFHPVPGTYTPWTTFHHTTVCYSDRNRLRVEIQGANNTTYNFLCYIFVDQGEFNQKNGIQTLSDYGLKTTLKNNDVQTTREQKVGFSSEYDTLQYFPGMITDYGTINLPAIGADFFDQNPQEGTYIDFMHTLGYPPFFLAFAEESGTSDRYSLPFGSLPILGGDGTNFALTGWADKQRIRITFYRKAAYPGPPFSGNFDASGNIGIRLFVFTENLGLQ